MHERSPILPAERAAITPIYRSVRQRKLGEKTYSVEKEGPVDKFCIDFDFETVFVDFRCVTNRRIHSSYIVIYYTKQLPMSGFIYYTHLAFAPLFFDRALAVRQRRS